MKAYTARFKKIENAFPKPDTEITVEISPLPTPEERKYLETKNPGMEYIWIDNETVRGQS
jgi:hypothetical protein